METATKKAYDLHAEHIEWKSKLQFYKDEILVLRSRVEEIATKNTDKEILSKIESFQNRLIIQRNEIDELMHLIKDHETYIENKVNNNPAADHKHLLDHQNERDRMTQFEKLFAEFRKELYGFLSKTM